METQTLSALLGALTGGAVSGVASSKKNRLRNTLLGAGAGGLLGYGAGSYLNRNAADTSAKVKSAPSVPPVVVPPADQKPVPPADQKPAPPAEQKPAPPLVETPPVPAPAPAAEAPKAENHIEPEKEHKERSRPPGPSSRSHRGFPLRTLGEEKQDKPEAPKAEAPVVSSDKPEAPKAEAPGVSAEKAEAPAKPVEAPAQPKPADPQPVPDPQAKKPIEEPPPQAPTWKTTNTPIGEPHERTMLPRTNALLQGKDTIADIPEFKSIPAAWRAYGQAFVETYYPHNRELGAKLFARQFGNTHPIINAIGADRVLNEITGDPSLAGVGRRQGIIPMRLSDVLFHLDKHPTFRDMSFSERMGILTNMRGDRDKRIQLSKDITPFLRSPDRTSLESITPDAVFEHLKSRPAYERWDKETLRQWIEQQLPSLASIPSDGAAVSKMAAVKQADALPWLLALGGLGLAGAGYATRKNISPEAINSFRRFFALGNRDRMAPTSVESLRDFAHQYAQRGVAAVNSSLFGKKVPDAVKALRSIPGLDKINPRWSWRPSSNAHYDAFSNNWDAYKKLLEEKAGRSGLEVEPNKGRLKEVTRDFGVPTYRQALNNLGVSTASTISGKDIANQLEVARQRMGFKPEDFDAARMRGFVEDLRKVDPVLADHVYRSEVLTGMMTQADAAQYNKTLGLIPKVYDHALPAGLALAGVGAGAGLLGRKRKKRRVEPEVAKVEDRAPSVLGMGLRHAFA